MEPQDGTPQHGSILVIEDDDAIRETLRYALESEGYQVFAAENGKKGMERLQQIQKPCLILLDLMMPVMNGWEFAEAIRKDRRLAPIPIVVVTAFTEQAKSLEVQGLVRKPVDLDVLFAFAQKWCCGPSPSPGV